MLRVLNDEETPFSVHYPRRSQWRG